MRRLLASEPSTTSIIKQKSVTCSLYLCFNELNQSLKKQICQTLFATTILLSDFGNFSSFFLLQSWLLLNRLTRNQVEFLFALHLTLKEL